MPPSAPEDEKNRVSSEGRRRPSAIVIVSIVVVAVVVAGILVYVTQSSSGPKSSNGGTTTTSTTTAHTPTKTFTSAAALAKARAQADKVSRRNDCPTHPQARVNQMHWTSPPPMSIDTSARYIAELTTTAGAFIITLDAHAAPQTVNNFIFLAEQGFYHCNVFDLVVPDRIVQTGDPTGTGNGGPGYSLPSENIPQHYVSGDVAMAQTGGTTNGSQFFIVLPGGSTHLSPKYSLFGTVISGIAAPELIGLQGNSNTNSGGSSSGVVERVIKVTIKER